MIDSVADPSIALQSAGAVPKTSDPSKIHSAAQQFESLLIGELLKSAHEEGGSGWLGTDDDDAGQTGIGFAEQQFSQMLAASGGFGLAPLIESGLRKEVAKAGQDASG